MKLPTIPLNLWDTNPTHFSVSTFFHSFAIHENRRHGLQCMVLFLTQKQIACCGENRSFYLHLSLFSTLFPVVRQNRVNCWSSIMKFSIHYNMQIRAFSEFTPVANSPYVVIRNMKKMNTCGIHGKFPAYSCYF